MTSAAQHRLQRASPDSQLTFDVPFPSGVLGAHPGQPASLEDAAAAVRAKFVPAQDPWDGARNAWLKNLPPVSRYRAGTAIVQAWAEAGGTQCIARRGGGLRIPAGLLEVKVSTVWASGEYTFQGIRAGENDLVALLGVSPQTLQLWLVTPAELATHLDKSTPSGGWVTFPADRPPPWLTARQAAPEALHAVERR